MWNYRKTILPVASKLCLGDTNLQLNLAVYNVILFILIFTVDLCTGFMCRIDKKGKMVFFGPINAKLKSNHSLLKIAVTLIGYFITYDEYYILTTIIVLEIICVRFLCVKILICDESSLWATGRRLLIKWFYLSRHSGLFADLRGSLLAIISKTKRNVQWASGNAFNTQKVY